MGNSLLAVRGINHKYIVIGGKWGHKQSVWNATLQDSSGLVFYDPENADFGNYTEFLGYFAFRHRTVSASTSATQVLTSVVMTEGGNETSYETKDNLNLVDFVDFVSGANTMDEVKSVVGEEHGHVGSGYIGDVYYTADGYTVAVYYMLVNGERVIDVIKLIAEDGSRTVLVN